jgi:hypothetical protein
MYCFCKEFLLKPGDYQNPFDSTRRTGIRCNFSSKGWFGGMIDCGSGYFEPYKRSCVNITTATTAAMKKIPYRSKRHACTAARALLLP